jgi:hypothetical protein
VLKDDGRVLGVLGGSAGMSVVERCGGRMTGECVWAT